ncbi:MAG: outer membrane beta-barrel protein [Kiritimatiellaeota bacterium]|nr:outer membrane beta-barrel protein [Kiritimatiellota bacterium]
MNGKIKALMIALALGLPAGASHAAEAASAMPAWIKDHVEVGTRITYFILQDDHRDFHGGNRFWGSINDLDVKQQYLPIKLFVAYKFNPYFGVELTMEQLAVETWSRPPNPLDGTTGTDGTINLMGPLASVFARYPNATRFTPYAGLGLGYFFASFDYEAVWHHPADFRSYDPTFYQDFKLDDSLAWLLYAGLAANLNERWSLDFQVRYMKLDVDGVTLTSRGGSPYYENGEFSFPLSNTSFGLGLRYSF